MKLTINDILNDHNLRLEESLAGEISDQERIHRMVFENEITENLLKKYFEEQQRFSLMSLNNLEENI